MAIWYILWPFGIFYRHLVYFIAIWYILWLFCIFSPVLVCCSKKNLATLLQIHLHTGRFIDNIYNVDKQAEKVCSQTMINVLCRSCSIVPD
jgi:hypothetical protein